MKYAVVGCPAALLQITNASDDVQSPNKSCFSFKISMTLKVEKILLIIATDMPSKAAEKF